MRHQSGIAPHRPNELHCPASQKKQPCQAGALGAPTAPQVDLDDKAAKVGCMVLAGTTLQKRSDLLLPPALQDMAAHTVVPTAQFLQLAPVLQHNSCTHCAGRWRTRCCC